ncbi:MAG: 6,7-dimethyl-8-ribityllumazine synthase [Candidatus Actinomarina sp.]|jgi:6,7-dimethyl-8-ribityllumazine synthase
MKNNIAIVVSDYYEDISNGLVDGFTNSLDPKFTIDTHNVTGAWEIIHKINSLTDKYDKFVAIGSIIKGGTDHYEYISQGVIDGLIKLTIDKNIYIANCVLNVHDVNDAYDRSKDDDNNKGSQAAFAINNLFT